MKRWFGRGVFISALFFVCILAGISGFLYVLRGSLSSGIGGRVASSGGPLVGVLRIQGGIFDAREALAIMERLRRSPRVKSLLLRIESPGGAVAPTQEIYEEILLLRRAGKKVIASLGSVAASGGYYIAAAADKIFANPGTITGSIGVVMILPNAEQAFESLGLKFNVIKSAPHKDLASPFRPLTGKGREILQGVVDDTYNQFLRAVAEGRKLSIEMVRRLADGRVFSGERAKELGLVDNLGSERQAALEAARMAGIQGEPVLLELTPETGLIKLFGRLVETTLGWFGLGGGAISGTPPAMLHYLWG